MYHCETPSLAGFIQQLAVSYLGNGYFFYVTGHVREGKDVKAVDAKLIERYQVDISKWARARKKGSGQANIQYLRHGRFFVLLATHGEHRFFQEEGELVKDARRVPVKHGSYSVSHRGGHPHVRIEQGEYNRLKAYLVGLAAHRSAESLRSEFLHLPFEPYAPVRRQLLNIHRAVNRARKAAGYDTLGYECLRLRRRIVRPFAAETQTCVDTDSETKAA
jgi:hypothetical protein